MRCIFSAAIAAGFLLSRPCLAAHCGAPGALNVNKSANGKAFIFFPSRRYGDSRFVLPGKEFRKDSSAPSGTVEFFVDGIHYQFLTTPKAQFIVDGEASDEATVLARHTAYEREFIAKAGSSLSEFEEIGSRQRPAVEGTPALRFHLWQMKVSKQKAAPRQYFLTTVFGDDVAMLSAIIGEAKYERQAMSAMESFAQTFKFLLPREPCPPK